MSGDLTCLATLCLRQRLSVCTGSVTCISSVPDLVRHQPAPIPDALPGQKPSESATWRQLARLSSASSSAQKESEAASWQLLTGHVSGHLKLWQGSEQSPLQALAVIRAAPNSPVKSLIILHQLHLVCSAHDNGQVRLYTIPHQPEELQFLPFQQAAERQRLPTVTMASTSFEAHKSGLQQCVAGDTGLVTVGAFGSIMVWPEAELRSIAHRASLRLPGR